MFAKKSPLTFKVRPRSPHFNVEKIGYEKNDLHHNPSTLKCGEHLNVRGLFFCKHRSQFSLPIHSSTPKMNQRRCLRVTKKSPASGGRLRAGFAPRSLPPPAGLFLLVPQTMSEIHAQCTIFTKQMKTMKTMKTIPENHSYLHENHENHTFLLKNTLYVFLNKNVWFSWFSFKYEWFSGIVFMVFMVFMCSVDSVL